LHQYVFDPELVHNSTEGTKIRAGDTSSQVLDENALTDETPSVPIKAQVLAVQIRAQKKRQLKADAAATAASGAVVHSLDMQCPTSRSIRWWPLNGSGWLTSLAA
jgi:hypothetical protein